MAIIGLLPALLATGAEAKEYKLLRPLNQVTAGDTITVGADFIEPSNDHYVIRLVVTNEATDRALLVKLEELQCFWGPSQALLKHSAFGIGERKMDFRPGETKSFTMSCPTGSGASGDFRVNLMRVYDDSTGDVLFDDVEWTIAEAAIVRKANKSLPDGFVPKVTDHPKPPPAGAAPTEPEGIVKEGLTAGAAVVEKIAETVEENLEEDRAEGAAEQGAAPAPEVP
jgi:hypothetical protein